MVSLTARLTGRRRLGIPEWQHVQHWLNKEKEASLPAEKTAQSYKLENKDIPILESYEECPDSTFWEKFPKNELPKKAVTKINVENFRKEIDKNRDRMAKTEIRRAERIVRDLEEGASAYQREPALPPVQVPNAKSAVENGPMLTDKIASWVEGKIVAGPFDHPPMPGFRANPLATVCRNGKVRPILNMSAPKGRSFNENMEERKLEKVHMSTAKEFSYAVREAGPGAKFSKFDIRDAYKLVPAQPKDLKLQGFKWLSKYFCETQETFGSRASVCNFDRLGRTKELMVCLNSGMPRDKVFRVLDDTPCISRKSSDKTELFSKEMRRFCKEISLPLADNCAKNDKAFENQTCGVVLGIRFDSMKMEWSMPEEKADKVITRCMEAKKMMHLDLLQSQKVMGSVNDMAQVCPIMRFHKGSGNRMVESFKGNNNILKPTTSEFKEDMKTIAKMAEYAKKGMPIAAKPTQPPLSALTIYSDAAGASFTMVKKKMVFHEQYDRGVSCLAGATVEEIWAGGKITWPLDFLLDMKDEKGVPYACKSTTLECMGMLIPFVKFPKEVQGRHVVFRIDNMAVAQGWETGYVRNDATATEVLKTAAYLAAYTGTTIHIDHVPRNSDSMAELVDELSRKKEAKNTETMKILEKAGYREIDGILTEWFKKPSTDGLMLELILKHIGKSL